MPMEDYEKTIIKIGVLVFKEGKLLLVNSNKTISELFVPSDSFSICIKDDNTEEIEDSLHRFSHDIFRTYTGMDIFGNKIVCKVDNWIIFKAFSNNLIRPNGLIIRSVFMCTQDNMKFLLDGNKLRLSNGLVGLRPVWMYLFKKINVLDYF